MDRRAFLGRLGVPLASVAVVGADVPRQDDPARLIEHELDSLKDDFRPFGVMKAESLRRMVETQRAILRLVRSRHGT